MDEMEEVVNGVSTIFSIVSKLRVILDNTDDENLKELYCEQVNEIYKTFIK